MTKEIMKYLLKRFHYIVSAIEHNQNSIFLKIGNRQERISIDREVNLFSDAVRKAINSMKDDFSRVLMKQSVLEGRSDIFIFTHNEISKGTYYRMKAEFINKLFQLCILAGLVSEDEIIDPTDTV